MFLLNCIAYDLGYNRAVVYRCLNTLVSRGYLLKSTVNNTYSPGYKLLEIGARAQEKMKLTEIARPYLVKLAEEAQESVSIAVPSGTCVAYLDKVESDAYLRAHLRVGMLVPSYCTGIGKAVLSYCDKPDIIDKN